jgi:hypothetical protein
LALTLSFTPISCWSRLATLPPLITSGGGIPCVEAGQNLSKRENLPDQREDCIDGWICPHPTDPGEEDDAYGSHEPENPSTIKVSVSRPDQIQFHRLLD